jgi:hypothetical protein
MSHLLPYCDDMTKMTKKQRREILTAAWLAAGNGQHAIAARLFASCGISYNHTEYN